MPWSAPFFIPIDLPDGKLLKTLSDARAYILKLPPKVAQTTRWQTATEVLLLVAEGGPTDFARIGIMQALYPKGEPIYETSRKTHWGRRKPKRNA